jgi:hypothetical protein
VVIAASSLRPPLVDSFSMAVVQHSWLSGAARVEQACEEYNKHSTIIPGCDSGCQRGVGVGGVSSGREGWRRRVCVEGGRAVAERQRV